MKKTIIAAATAVVIAGGIGGGYYLNQLERKDMFELVMNGCPWQLKYRIARGTDINTVGGEDKSLLMQAMSKPDNSANILALIDAGADVNQNINDVTPLGFAALAQNDSKVFEALLAHGAEVNAPLKDNSTVLMMAAGVQKDPKIIELLIEHGADVNAVNNSGQTALMFAAEMNPNPDIIKTLALAGASTNFTNPVQGSILQHALLQNNPLILQALLNHGAQVQPHDLMIAINEGDALQLLAMMLEQIGDPNFTDSYGNTPLTLAAGNPKSSPEVIELLIKAGADVNKSDRKGTTPLMKAAARPDEISLLRLIAAAGSQPDVENAPEELKNTLAAEKAKTAEENAAVLSLLIEAGADVNRQDDDGMTALMYAAATGKSPEMMDQLAKAGADLYKKNKAGLDAYELSRIWREDREKTLK